MLDAERLTALFKYNAWADNMLFDAMKALPRDVLSERTGTLFESMVGTLNHNLQVDLIWRAHMLGREHGFTSRRDVLHERFEDVAAAQVDMNAWFIDWCTTQAAAALDEHVSFRFVSGNPGRMRRSDMLFHVINHKTYHRGWIAEMFFQSGFVPPEIDLSAYLSDASVQRAA